MIAQELCAQNIISEEDEEIIRKTQRNECKNHAAMHLLDAIPRKNSNWYEAFLTILYHNEHHELVKMIDEKIFKKLKNSDKCDVSTPCFNEPMHYQCHSQYDSIIDNSSVDTVVDNSKVIDEAKVIQTHKERDVPAALSIRASNKDNVNKQNTKSDSVQNVVEQQKTTFSNHLTKEKSPKDICAGNVDKHVLSKDDDLQAQMNNLNFKIDTLSNTLQGRLDKLDDRFDGLHDMLKTICEKIDSVK